PLLVLLAACSTAGEDTTTTAPLAEPSTTSTTTTAQSTTTEPTTTPTEEECVERDGVLRTRRGFVCPPHLKLLEAVPGFGLASVEHHLPGEYRTRLATPAFSFRRTDRFESFGEGPAYLQLDEKGNWFDVSTDSGGILAFPSSETFPRFTDMQPVNRTEGFDWFVDLTVQEQMIGGHPATISTFTVVCRDPTGVVDSAVCLFGELAPALDWGQVDGQRTAVVVIENRSGPLTILAETHNADDFDTYWAEVAQPILDSIEFLDP
ncbi:MAG: hypothetical protein R3324_21865, partial [Halobacteriales archaeon]|nr:hypothetical protein [Halobacteriales archaeon]